MRHKNFVAFICSILFLIVSGSFAGAQTSAAPFPETDNTFEKNVTCIPAYDPALGGEFCFPVAAGCEITGYGPGNKAACLSTATACQTTGYGPGNDVACGGEASICETTGNGPGNSAACGG